MKTEGKFNGQPLPYNENNITYERKLTRDG